MYLTINRVTSTLTICCIIFCFLLASDFLFPYEQLPDYFGTSVYVISILASAFISFFILGFSENIIKEKAFRFPLTGFLAGHFYFLVLELSVFSGQVNDNILTYNSIGGAVLILLRIIFLISLYRTTKTIWHRYLKISSWLSILQLPVVFLIPYTMAVLPINPGDDYRIYYNGVTNILRNLHLIPILLMIRFFLSNGNNIQHKEYRNEEILDLHE
jgi:hypothetical protein